MADLAKLQQELTPETTAAGRSLELLRAWNIGSLEQMTQAADVLKATKRKIKDLDDKRTGITKPLLEAKRRIDDLFMPAITAYKEAERILKTKIGAYAAEREQERAAAMQQAADQYAAGGSPTDPIPEPARVQGVTTRQVWDFRVEEPDKVPRELCSPDPTKIKEAIWYADTPHNPPQAIPGVVFYLRDDVRVRT